MRTGSSRGGKGQAAVRLRERGSRLTAFADSSALVKLYADEPGHSEVRGLEGIVVSQVARVEVPAAIWRKRRLGELDMAVARDLTSRFEDDWFGHRELAPRFVVVTISPGLLDDAARLCAVHGLRAYDGVQLSSALAARQADAECSVMATFDRSVRAAATVEGFTLIPTLAD